MKLLLCSCNDYTLQCGEKQSTLTRFVINAPWECRESAPWTAQRNSEVPENAKPGQRDVGGWLRKNRGEIKSLTDLQKAVRPFFLVQEPCALTSRPR